MIQRRFPLLRLRSGFTLVELLCATVLLALAATIVTVRLAGTTDAARLRSARLEIETALRRARQFVLTRHRPAWLEIDAANSRVRPAFATGQSASGAWTALEGVRISDVETGDGAEAQSALTRIRVTAAGVTLPWRATLATLTAETRFSSDGISDRLQVESPTPAPQGAH